MGFTWECDGNTLEEKGMIEDSLPEGFTYKIAKYKLIERSEIKEEIKFRAVFSVSVSDKEEATIFIEKIATLNGTELRKRTKEMRRKDFASQRYNCSRKTMKNKLARTLHVVVGRSSPLNSTMAKTMLGSMT